MTIILFMEGETMGSGAQIIVGGLNSGEMSTQYITRLGYQVPK